MDWDEQLRRMAEDGRLRGPKADRVIIDEATEGPWPDSLNGVMEPDAPEAEWERAMRGDGSWPDLLLDWLGDHDVISTALIITLGLGVLGLILLVATGWLV